MADHPETLGALYELLYFERITDHEGHLFVISSAFSTSCCLDPKPSSTLCFPENNVNIRNCLGVSEKKKQMQLIKQMGVDSLMLFIAPLWSRIHGNKLRLTAIVVPINIYCDKYKRLNTVCRYTVKQNRRFRHLSSPKRHVAVGPIWLLGGTKLHGTAQDGDRIKLP